MRCAVTLYRFSGAATWGGDRVALQPELHKLKTFTQFAVLGPKCLTSVTGRNPRSQKAVTFLYSSEGGKRPSNLASGTGITFPVLYRFTALKPAEVVYNASLIVRNSQMNFVLGFFPCSTRLSFIIPQRLQTHHRSSGTSIPTGFSSLRLRSITTLLPRWGPLQRT